MKLYVSIHCFVIWGYCLAQVASEIASICSGNHALTCSGGDVLVIQSVSWATTSACGRESPGNVCASSFTFAYLARLCFGVSRCMIEYSTMAANKAPCDNNHVELLVDYVCVINEDIYDMCSYQDMDIRAQFGIVHSKNYPQRYPVNSECRCRLSGRQGQIMKVTMLYLNMEYSEVRNSCDDPLVFTKSDSTPKHYTFCDPSKINYTSKLIRERDETFTWKYDLRNSTQVRVSFESSQFEHNPDRGFMFKFELEGCANDDVERFTIPKNGKRTTFEPSRRVAYQCNQGFQMERSGTGEILCDGSRWVGDPGTCIDVSLVIEPEVTTTSRATTSTTSPTTTTTSTTTTTTQTTTQAETTTQEIRSTTTTTETAKTTTVATETTSEVNLASRSTKSSLPSSSTSHTTTPLAPVTESSTSTSTSPNGKDPKNNPTATTTTTTEAPAGAEDTTTTFPPFKVNGAVEEDGSIPVWTMTAIGLSVGIIGIILIFLLIILAIKRSRRKKKAEEREPNPITSLRPSPHACVSIPNTYGGNIGFGVPKNSALRVMSQSKPRKDRDELDEAAINRQNSSNDTTVLISQDEVGGSERSSVSFPSSINLMSSNGKGPAPPVPNGSGTFIPDETAVINPDFYVERTGYAAGTTGFLQDSTEFPEVHFVEVDSPRHSGLEPIAEESQLHHSDIIADPTNSQEEQMDNNIVIMDAVMRDLQNRNSGGSSSHNSAGLATIPEEEREAADGEEESLRSTPPSTAPRTNHIQNRPYSRTSLEGTRIPRATLKQIEKSKVQYPLFKDDETGNLENYLDDRRGSY